MKNELSFTINFFEFLRWKCRVYFYLKNSFWFDDLKAVFFSSQIWEKVRFCGRDPKKVWDLQPEFGANRSHQSEGSFLHSSHQQWVNIFIYIFKIKFSPLDLIIGMELAVGSEFADLTWEEFRASWLGPQQSCYGSLKGNHVLIEKKVPHTVGFNRHVHFRLINLSRPSWMIVMTVLPL